MALVDKTYGGDGNDTFVWKGGKGTLYAQGTWDTATLKLQWSIDGGNNWEDIGSLTANGKIDIDHGPVDMRTDVSSSGASTSVAVKVLPMTYRAV